MKLSYLVDGIILTIFVSKARGGIRIEHKTCSPHPQYQHDRMKAGFAFRCPTPITVQHHSKVRLGLALEALQSHFGSHQMKSAFAFRC